MIFIDANIMITQSNHIKMDIKNNLQLMKIIALTLWNIRGASKMSAEIIPANLLRIMPAKGNDQVSLDASRMN